MRIKEEIDSLNDGPYKSEYKVIEYSIILDIINHHKKFYSQKQNFQFSNYFDDILNLLEYLTYDNKTLCEIKLNRRND